MSKRMLREGNCKGENLLEPPRMRFFEHNVFHSAEALRRSCSLSLVPRSTELLKDAVVLHLFIVELFPRIR